MIKRAVVGLMVVLTACHTPYKVRDYSAANMRIHIDSLQLYDTAMANMIAPYKLKLDAEMNEVIGMAEGDLTRDLPDGSLGNFVADVCLDYAKKNQPTPVDFCVLNAGGVRIPSIQKGNITVGKIYELMPFDNSIEVVTLTGQQCLQLFAWIAKWKGAPVSGLALNLVDGNAVNVLINNQPFDVNQNYTVATTDFIANGGDGAIMFAKGIRYNTNYKLRDALLAFVRSAKTIHTNTHGRIKQN